MTSFSLQNLRADMFVYFVRILVLLLAMPIHEYAHAKVADMLGDNTPRSLGRLTLNPIAHLDPIGSLCLVLFGFGWAKPVLVTGRGLKRPKRDMALISGAGPLANVLLSLVLMIIYKLCIAFLHGIMPAYMLSTLATILVTTIQISLFLAVFNLLPIPPLDGAKFFGAVLPSKIYFTIMRYERIFYIILVVLMITGILMMPISIASNWLVRLLDFITSPLDLLVR